MLERLSALRFGGSREYWETRYSQDGDSGSGSRGRLARFKAEFLNSFVLEHDVGSVIEFGCGDGRQLQLAEYPRYIGLDVSRVAVALCSERFGSDETKSFFLYDPSCFIDHHRIFQADMATSLDVIYHLVEDAVFDSYMTHLFDSAERYVIIYSSDFDTAEPAAHVLHREFTSWVAERRPDWHSAERVANRYPFDPLDPDNTSFCDFFVFQRSG